MIFIELTQEVVSDPALPRIILYCVWYDIEGYSTGEL